MRDGDEYEMPSREELCDIYNCDDDELDEIMDYRDMD